MSGQPTEADIAAVLADWLDRDDVSENRAADEVRKRADEVNALLRPLLTDTADARAAGAREALAEADIAAVRDRIVAGRAKHGVGASEDFPGNVCHLVSPIVGTLRLHRRDGAEVPGLDWIIDRLRLVLDMAEQEAADTANARAAGAREALDAVLARGDEGNEFGPLSYLLLTHIVSEVRVALAADTATDAGQEET